MFNTELSVPQLTRPSLLARVPERDIQQARHEFFHQSLQPTELVSERILHSWQRCINQGMAVDHVVSSETLTRAELTVAFDRPQLLALVEPELEFLESALTNSEAVIAFADSRGIVIDSRGGARSNKCTVKDELTPGACWSEKARGTNGIGTAIADGRLVEVWGAEHFHEDYSGYSCTAAPVLDHTGAIAGIVNVTGSAGLPRGYARALVKRAVREIEYRWVNQISNSFSTFIFHPHFSHLNSSQAGVLLFDDDRVVGANRYALRWLGMNWSIIGKRWEDCFESPMPMGTIGPMLPRQRIQFAYEMRSSERKVSTVLHQEQVKPRQLRSATVTSWFNRDVRAQLERARRAANAGLTTVVLGETGTGKEMFARAVHLESTRRSRPFITINCAALPETLIESELFGYGAGAYTGAKRNGSPGRVLEASGGILFLDEIGDMPVAMQTRLLRVLQDKQVTPLGEGAAKPVDLVVMCATHRNLETMVKQGSFRADLYYRLQHLMVRLPSWREYTEEDRLAALDFFWKDSGAEERGLRLSPQARNHLVISAWPGNLRQCANMIKTLVALSDDGATLEVDSLSHEVRSPQTATADLESNSLSELTNVAIERALELHKGNVKLAADDLGVHRTTLYRQLKRRSIRKESPLI